MKRLMVWIPPLLWMALIFALSSRHSVTVSSEYVLNFLFFKTLHVMEYAVLYALVYRASDNFLSSFIITILYAVSDELHQTLVPTREGKLRDVIIDALGATLAWHTLRQLLPKAPKKLKNWAKHWGFA
jgi:VanZ family protein